MLSFADAVVGGEWRLELANKWTIDQNYLSSIMTTLNCSIHSPAAVTSNAMKLHCCCRMFRQQENPSAIWFFTPEMGLTSQSMLLTTIGTSIWQPVRCGWVRIQHNVAWFIFTKNGCLALSRLNFQYIIISGIPDSSLLDTGYHVSVLWSLWLKYHSTFSALSWTCESTTPNTYLLPSMCRHYLDLRSGRARPGVLQSVCLRALTACWHSQSQANTVYRTFLHSQCRWPPFIFRFGQVWNAYNGITI